MRRFAVIATLIVTAFGSVANAEAVVNFDPETGTGSVDVGVIGASFGWTPEQLQQEAGALGFVLAKEQEFTASCDGVPTAHITERTDYILDFSEQRDVDGNLRTFNLTGLGRAVGRPSLPRVGGECGELPSPYPRVWTSLAEETPQYRLYVAYRGLEVLLWPGSGAGILREPVDGWEEIRGSLN